VLVFVNGNWLKKNVMHSSGELASSKNAFGVFLRFTVSKER